MDIRAKVELAKAETEMQKMKLQALVAEKDLEMEKAKNEEVCTC